MVEGIRKDSGILYFEIRASIGKYYYFLKPQIRRFYSSGEEK
jgi:hypothetical protein